MRASAAAEAAGVPSVSLVCSGFVRQGVATGQGVGYDSLALGVLHGHVDTQSLDEMISHLRDATIDQIVAGLTIAPTLDSASAQEPTALETTARGSISEINAHFLANGWSDGLPIIPPTREQVVAFLGPLADNHGRVLGSARPSGREITLWSIAVNAVMTGCDPRHRPLLIAMAEIIADPAYGVEHSGNTTGADALVIVNGRSSADLGFNAGPGALREGAHANTSVGRWLRLYLRNVCGFTAEEHDKATFGNSTRVVLAEDEQALNEIGWDPVSAEFGFARGDNVVSLARMNSGLIIGGAFGATAEALVPYLADGLVRVSGWDLAHIYGLGQGHYRPLLILSPLLARTIAGSGWSKDDLKQALFDQARLPALKFEQLIGDWTNINAGRRSLFELAAAGLVPPVFGESDDPNRLVPIVTAASKFVVAVAGDPNRNSAYVMSNDGPHGDWTAKSFDR
jgi:hypothetical protein